MRDSNADQLIADLGERMGVPGLRFGNAGTCQLVFDQRWVVTLVLERGTGRILLNCPLCPPLQADGLPAPILRAMLEANFMGRGIAGAMLSIAPDRRAYLQIQLPLREAGEAGLRDVLESFLNQAETWAARLEVAPDSTIAQPEVKRASHTQPAWAMQRV